MITSGVWTGAPVLTYSLEVDGVEVVAAGSKAAAEAYVYVLADAGLTAIAYEIPDGNAARRVASNTVAVLYSPFADPVFIATWDPAHASNTLVGSDIDILADLKVSGRDLAALSATQRPTQTASVDLGGATIANFASAAPDCVQNTTKSLWRLLHEGTGSTLIIIYNVAGAAVQTIWDTNNGTTLVLGAHWNHDTSLGRLIVRVANGTASVFNATTAGGSAPPGAYVGTVRYEEGRPGNEWDVRLSGVSKASGNSAAAPASGDAFGNFRLALTNGNAFPFNGPIAAVFLADSYLDDSVIEQVEAWAAPIYGT